MSLFPNDLWICCSKTDLYYVREQLSGTGKTPDSESETSKTCVAVRFEFLPTLAEYQII